MPFIGRKTGTLTTRQQCYNDVHGADRAVTKQAKLANHMQIKLPTSFIIPTSRGFDALCFSMRTDSDTVLLMGGRAHVCSSKMKNTLHNVNAGMQHCTALRACLQSLIHVSPPLNIYTPYNGSGMLLFLSADRAVTK